MKTLVSVLLAVAVAVVGLSLASPTSAQDEEKNNEQEGVDTMARGQVHEAFAEAGHSTATPGVVVSKVPPDAIEEQPPEEKPEGDTVAWISGYWGWDEENNDFVWVSGAWRAFPVGRSWVPGSWQKVTTGHQWVSGYWGEIEQKQEEQQTPPETEYLPAPPAKVIEAGPSTPQPADDYSYVPGIYVYRETRYLWRPGFWVKYRPNWVWIPACYKWTPCGHVYVSGFWDAPLCDRGFLFAPVVIRRNVYLRRGFVYRPTHVIQPDFFIGSLFVRSRSRTYYFGNFFEERYRKSYVSWVDYRIHKVSYDPNYSYYRTAYVKHPTWDRNLRTLYSARYSGDIARPPVSLAAQRTVVRTIVTKQTGNTVVHKDVAITNVQNVTVLSPVRKATTVRVTGMATLAGFKPSEVAQAPVSRVVKVETASKTRLQAESRQIERMRVVGQQRKVSEVKAVASLPKSGVIEKPIKLKVELPKTIPAARVIKTTVKPPPSPERSKVDPTPKDKDKGKVDPIPLKDKDKGKVDPIPLKDKGKVDPIPLKDKAKDKGKVDPIPLKDKSKVDPIPLKDKSKVDPIPLKDKGKTPPPPNKDKFKVDPIPVKDKSKVDPIPLKDKGKTPLPPNKDKFKVDPPPNKDKFKVDPIPLKDKGKVDPVPLNKDKGKVDPVPLNKDKGKVVTPPPVKFTNPPPPPPKITTPPPPKDKGTFEVPPPKDKGTFQPPPPPKGTTIPPPPPPKGTTSPPPPPPKGTTSPPPPKGKQ